MKIGSVLYSASFCSHFIYLRKGMRGEENPTDNGAELSLDLTENNNLK